MYKLNDIDIKDYGAIAARGSEHIALEGIFSFPKRKGDTERNWGTEIEPFIEAHEIEFDGRALNLNVWITGTSPAEYNGNLTAFKNACISCRTLSTGYADFTVMLKDEVKVQEYIKDNRAFVAAAFWQQDVVFPSLTLPASGGGSYLLDGYSLRNDFGIRVSKRQDNNNTGKRLEVNTTMPYTETRYRDKTDVILKCYMRGVDFADLYGNITRFHALCATPGLRVLQFPDGTKYTGYIKDGFTAKAVHRTKLDFDFKLRTI